jgi:hypothetical protein
MADYVVWRNNKGATSATSANIDNSLSVALLGLPVVRSSGAAVGSSVIVSGSLALPVTQVAAENESVATAEPPLLVGLSLFNAIAMPSSGTSVNVIGSAAVIESASESDLLLVDQAMAELDRDDEAGADDAVWCDAEDEDESVSDMALAAVLDDGWWVSM